MKPFNKCPVCGGTMESKVIEKLLRGGTNTAVVKAPAEVCRHCGEQLYSTKTVRKFEQIRGQLSREETSGLKKIGLTFAVMK
ncbi:MAG: YgiT-type zinc finger protein [Candidatus Edwardsbacteria bacterium]|nr:YgiT-type zinc finger protein [Candidatus Edwardsbacteria bacterium]